MKLYDAPVAPSPRRVRVFMAEKGIDVPRETIDLRALEQLGEAYRAINPRCTVPALLLDSGELIDESAAICRFLEALHPDPPLFGTRPEAIGLIESWTRRIEGEGYAAVAYVLRNGNPRFAGRAIPGGWDDMVQIPELVTRGTRMWAAFLDMLDARLDGRQWIVGDAISFADITALVALDFAAAAQLDGPATRLNIARWHGVMAARPSAAA